MALPKKEINVDILKCHQRQLVSFTLVVSLDGSNDMGKFLRTFNNIVSTAEIIKCQTG
jgi:hypothetical protein